MPGLAAEPRFALCVRSDDCEDLDRRKVYRVLADPAADAEGYLRVLDESVDDYLYPATYFILLDLPREAQKALAVSR